MDSVQLSKTLNHYLRRFIVDTNIPYNEFGEVSLSSLLTLVNEKKKTNLSEVDIVDLIKNDDRNRFSYSKETGLIRANYGHVFKVTQKNIILEAAIPEFLYTMSHKAKSESIVKNGFRVLDKDNSYYFSNREMVESKLQDSGMKDSKDYMLVVINTTKVPNMNSENTFSINDGVWLTSVDIPSSALFFNNKNKNANKNTI